jgi:hypothetical protein
MVLLEDTNRNTQETSEMAKKHNWKNTTKKGTTRWSAVCRNCGLVRQMVDWDKLTTAMIVEQEGSGYQYFTAGKRIDKLGACRKAVQS